MCRNAGQNRLFTAAITVSSSSSREQDVATLVVRRLTNREVGAGLGEVMLMIAVMIAVQAELVWRRAARLTWTEPSPAHGASSADAH